MQLAHDPGLMVTAIMPWSKGRPLLEEAFSLRLLGETVDEKLDYLWESLTMVAQVISVRFPDDPLTMVAYEDNGPSAKRDRYGKVAESRRAMQTIRCFWHNFKGVDIKPVSTSKDCKEEARLVARRYNYGGNEHTRDALLIGYFAHFDLANGGRY